MNNMNIPLLLLLFAVATFLVAYGIKKLQKQKVGESFHTRQPDHSPMFGESGNLLPLEQDDTDLGNSHRVYPELQHIDNPEIQRLRHFCIKDKGYHASVWPKDQYIGDYLEFNIAGITHGEHVNEHLGEFVATLEPEPTNTYDPSAIKIVTSEGHRVGYVPRNITDRIRDFATLPCTCYCYIGTNDGIYFSDCYITRNEKISTNVLHLRKIIKRNSSVNKQ